MSNCRSVTIKMGEATPLVLLNLTFPCNRAHLNWMRLRKMKRNANPRSWKTKLITIFIYLLWKPSSNRMPSEIPRNEFLRQKRPLSKLGLSRDRNFTTEISQIIFLLSSVKLCWRLCNLCLNHIFDTIIC